MKWVWYSVAFAAGAVVGGLVVREMAISKIETPVGKAVDALLGPDTYASGQIKTSVNAFLRN
jgi:hypothetical protein